MAKKRSGKSIFPFIIMAVAAYFIFFNEDERPQVQKPDSPISTNDYQLREVAVDAASSLQYAFNALRNDWPEADSDTDVLTVSDELLASNYYLVLDASGSMKGNSCSSGRPKIKSAIDALSHFTSRLPADANFGLAVFHKSRLKELLPLGRNNRADVVMLVSRLSPDGGTPLDRAIAFGYKKLLSQGQRQLGYGEYNLVLVTDGIASDGHDPTRVVDDMLYGAPVALHTIGFCIEDNHSLNQPGLTVYRSANDPESLKQGLVEVLAESPEFDLSSFAE